MEVTSGSGRENYYVILCLKVSILHVFRGEIRAALKTQKKKKQNGKKNYTPNISERRERVEKVKREKGRIVRLM